MNMPYSIPSLDKLKLMAKMTPKFMYPSITPWVVIWEGGLSSNVCDSIIEIMMVEEPYKFPSCLAITRECPLPLHPIFDPIIQFTLEMNNVWWGFDLTHTAAAWFQTYEVGDKYNMHMDGAPGQTRKLSTIVLLSDESEYEGGVLKLTPFPEQHEVPKTKGTMCTFPSWILHEVYPIERGLRQTINLGFWGPSFK
jgi:2OG-Fe(II) oxygenase superfamily